MPCQDMARVTLHALATYDRPEVTSAEMARREYPEMGIHTRKRFGQPLRVVLSSRSSLVDYGFGTKGVAIQHTQIRSMRNTDDDQSSSNHKKNNKTR